MLEAILHQGPPSFSVQTIIENGKKKYNCATSPDDHVNIMIIHAILKPLGWIPAITDNARLQILQYFVDEAAEKENAFLAIAPAEKTSFMDFYENANYERFLAFYGRSIENFLTYKGTFTLDLHFDKLTRTVTLNERITGQMLKQYDTFQTFNRKVHTSMEIFIQRCLTTNITLNYYGATPYGTLLNSMRATMTATYIHKFYDMMIDVMHYFIIHKINSRKWGFDFSIGSMHPEDTTKRYWDVNITDDFLFIMYNLFRHLLILQADYIIDLNDIPTKRKIIECYLRIPTSKYIKEGAYAFLGPPDMAPQSEKAFALETCGMNYLDWTCKRYRYRELPSGPDQKMTDLNRLDTMYGFAYNAAEKRKQQQLLTWKNFTFV